jgi:DNA-binding response OmpR family regulator
MRVLIADDDAVTTRILSKIITSAGYAVTVVSSGAEALEALQAEDPPDIALLDWVMPEMDGPDVCKAVKARERPAPTYLILLTAKGGSTDVIAGLEAGADDYLVKPVNPGELRARLNAGARIVQLQQSLAAHVQQLQDALASVKTLTGLVPICGYCKSIRDDSDYWHRVEEYISDHTGAQFSHGICPSCMDALEKRGVWHS